MLETALVVINSMGSTGIGLRLLSMCRVYVSPGVGEGSTGPDRLSPEEGPWNDSSVSVWRGTPGAMVATQTS